MFCPKSSVIKKRYKTDLLKRYDLRGVDETWSAELQTLEEHRKLIYSIAVSPGPRTQLIASGSGDNTVKLWYAHSGELYLPLRGHTAHVKSVAFSPDGGILASGSCDKTIKLWDSSTGKVIHTIKDEDHPDWVTSVGFSRLILVISYWHLAIAMELSKFGVTVRTCWLGLFRATLRSSILRSALLSSHPTPMTRYWHLVLTMVLSNSGILAQVNLSVLSNTKNVRIGLPP